MYKKNSALYAVDGLLLEDKDEPSPAASTYLECEVDKYEPSPAASTYLECEVDIPRSNRTARKWPETVAVIWNDGLR